MQFSSLHKVVLLGVVAGTCLTGCKSKQEKAVDNATTATADAMKANTTAATQTAGATSSTAGMPAECDAYFTRVQNCVSKQDNAMMADQFKKAMDMNRQQWAAISDKAALTSACKSANSTFDQSAKMLHCE